MVSSRENLPRRDGSSYPRMSRRKRAPSAMELAATIRPRSGGGLFGHLARDTFLVPPFAPVVKRTSRRSPEPQVRVRFPAGAQQNFNETVIILDRHRRQNQRLCPDCAHCYSLAAFITN